MTEPLRIGLLMKGGPGWIGGSEYIRNLILALASLPDEERTRFELCLIHEQPLEESLLTQIRPALSQLLDLSPLRKKPTGLARLAAWFAGFFPQDRNRKCAEYLRNQKIDFLYPLTYAARQSMLRLPLGPEFPCAWAGWIPDFQHTHMPELFPAADIQERDRGIAILAHEAPVVVLSSHAAEADLQRLDPPARAKASVLSFCTFCNDAWFRADPRETVAKYHLPERFFLVSNQFWQHKNHGVVFDALGLLAQKGVRVEIVCTGEPGDYRNAAYFSSMLQRIHTLGIAPNVHVLGLIARIDQVQLMRASVAVVQPSLFEGWSTVVEDARLLGKPVVLSDLAVHREQNPPGTRFFDPASPTELAAALEDAWLGLQSGPDLDREEYSKTAARAATQAYARRFLEITELAVKTWSASKG